MPRHNTLTDPNLHEPKGVASAASGQMYTADGAGSGSWLYNPTGWAFYKDDSAEQTFDTTAAKLLISGGDSSSTSLYLPNDIRGTGELWDTTNSLIDPIQVGDSYTVRLDLPVTSRSGANYGVLELDIGGTSSPSIVIMSRRFDTTRAAPFDISMSFSLFTLSTFISNGGQFFITTDSGSIGVTTPSVFITRTHGEV